MTETKNFQTEADDGWTPEFAGQRPPFAPGNQLSVGSFGDLRHGIWSTRKVDPIAHELIENLLADDGVAHLREPRWAAAVAAWGRCEARVELLLTYIAGLAGEGQLGDLDDPKIRTAYKLLERFEASAVQQRGRLGLDPLSAAKLGRDKAAGGLDVARLMAKLAEADQGLDVDGEVEHG